MFSRSGNTIRLLIRMLDVRKWEKSKMAVKRRDKFDYWSMFGTVRGCIRLTFKGCKYDTMYIFTNVIMFRTYVNFILSTLLPIFSYAIWFRKRPTHMSDCVRNFALYVIVQLNTQTLLSTMHNDAKVSLGEHEKLGIFLFYNDTKGGIYTIDQMCRHFTCKSGTRCWPMAMFYNLVDIDAALNAFVIWKKLNPQWPHVSKCAKTNDVPADISWGAVVVGSTLAFWSIGHRFKSKHRLLSHHSASAFRKLRSLAKCLLDNSVRWLQ